jgi:hypothetical protein
MRMVLDLPAALGPSTPRISPFPTVKEYHPPLFCGQRPLSNALLQSYFYTDALKIKKTISLSLLLRRNRRFKTMQFIRNLKVVKPVLSRIVHDATQHRFGLGEWTE